MKTAVWFVVLCGLLTNRAAAQTPPEPDVVAAAEGAALLAQGNVERAAAVAAQVLRDRPFSTAGLRLAVDVDLARAGSNAALGTYERWASLNTREDPPALRRVVLGALREAARNHQDRAARMLAAEALLAEGDPEMAAELNQSTAAEDAPLRAAAGSAEAITALIAQLNDPIGNKRTAMMGLVKSRSRRAVAPIAALLSDPNPIVRMEAAEALGELGFKEAATNLKPLLTMPGFPVQFAAAAALVKLGDPAGRQWLQQLRSNEAPALRLAAAQATRTDPDGGWLALVRDLAGDPDPDIRRQAATLLAPHDPEAARQTLLPLLDDPNRGEREAALEAYLDVTDDFGVLRKSLRSTDGRIRVRAAARIAQLTRAN